MVLYPFDNLYYVVIISTMRKDIVDQLSDEPIYKQLADKIESQIISGELKPGKKLPSENEFCEIYSVSRITVRQALNILVQKGLVYSVHGKGSFVKVAEIEQDLSKIVRFGSALSLHGQDGFTRVVAYDTGKHISRATEALGTDGYFDLFLLGHIQQTPVVYYKSYINNKYKKDVYLAAKKLELVHKPFSTLDVYDTLGIKIKSIKQSISAIISDGKSGEMLGLFGNQALLRLESIYYLEDGSAIEYKTAYYRSDVYHFELNREIND